MSENSFRFPYGLIESVAPSLQMYTEFGGYKVGKPGVITSQTQYMLPPLKLKRHLTAAHRPERINRPAA